MNWRRLYLFLVVVSSLSLFSQVNLLNAKKVEEIGVKTQEQLDSEDDKPLPYGYIADRDVLWSKIVWEYVDLGQKINLPYYYPIDTVSATESRRSLYDSLLRGIKKQEIKEVYGATDDGYFITRATLEDIAASTKNDRDDGMGNIDTYSIKSNNIKGFQLKGLWYFDKRGGELKYRLLGIAPMAPDVQSIGVEDIEDDAAYPLFWVFYPDARETLHKAEVFNPKNSSKPLTYDNLLNARRFNSVILREENMYGDRLIKDYVRGNSLFQLLEADRIKEGIRDREMDMWNY